jgi:hypothetical protein
MSAFADRGNTPIRGEKGLDRASKMRGVSRRITTDAWFPVAPSENSSRRPPRNQLAALFRGFLVGSGAQATSLGPLRSVGAFRFRVETSVQDLVGLWGTRCPTPWPLAWRAVGR